MVAMTWRVLLVLGESLSVHKGAVALIAIMVLACTCVLGEAG
jgi:hypothetical protein